MKKWHLSLSSDGRHSLFPTEGARRAAVRIIVGHAGSWLVSFGIADDHLHVELYCSRRRAGKLARALRLGLGTLAGCGFEPTYLDAVDSRTHAVALVKYNIQQPVKHGLPCHPALWDGSCFSDIIGARVIDGLQLRIGDVLPRFRVGDAWDAAGLPYAGIPPAVDEEIRARGLPSLREASAFAVCVDPRLKRRTPLETLARSNMVSLTRQVGFRVKDTAATLGVSPEAVRQLGSRPVDVTSDLLKPVYPTSLRRWPASRQQGGISRSPPRSPFPDFLLISRAVGRVVNPTGYPRARPYP